MGRGGVAVLYDPALAVVPEVEASVTGVRHDRLAVLEWLLYVDEGAISVGSAFHIRVAVIVLLQVVVVSGRGAARATTLPHLAVG